MMTWPLRTNPPERTAAAAEEWDALTQWALERSCGRTGQVEEQRVEVATERRAQHLQCLLLLLLLLWMV